MPRARPAEPLETYRGRRDFSRTPEPPPQVEKPAPGAPLGFVVQKHAARRLHWDFRLELGGVLKSWAVTRGPSADPADRRLAVRTEDHPVAYAGFEGRIPQGEYGGGTVMLWDRGRWHPRDPDPAAALDAGRLTFTLDGERMRGQWSLVRLRRKPGETRENWLLLKAPDAHAAPGLDLAQQHPTSIESGRSMAAIAGAVDAGRPKATRRRKIATALPAHRPPQLATLVDRPPEGPEWLHEIKHDGYRALVATAGGRARLTTRSGADWSERFPTLLTAAARHPGAALLDGELVVTDAEGRSRFGLLQQALAAGDDRAIRFIAFDLLVHEGADVSSEPLVRRKALLAPLVAELGEPFGYSDHVEGAGAQTFAHACRMGLEGIVSKRATGRYTSRRDGDWRKTKCIRRREFVIVGWLPSPAGRGFRSLLLATRDRRRLTYAGKVGTGFGAAEMDALLARLADLETREPPVAAPPAAVRGARWVEPRLVGEVAYAEVTAEGVLRHASWIGLREDKPASRVKRERAAAPEVPAGISNADRVIFPESGITKGALAAYYARFADLILETAGNRYLSLVRCPEGRARHCFFQKHVKAGFEGVHRSPPDADGDCWLFVDDADGVLRCVQMGTIEFHGWGAPADHPDRPDRLVIDLDPDEGLAFADLLPAAIEVRDELNRLGLASEPLLSGGKGVHVVAPLDGGTGWPEVKDFARRFALALAEARPERYTAALSKAKRRGRIFLDWLRNQEGATAVMPWTVRARPGAPVAVPITWAELADTQSAARFTLADVDAIAAHAAARRAPRLPPQTLPDF